MEKREQEASYLAGMIDADGCIALNYNRDHYEVRVEVCQSSKSNLEKLQKLWGGRIQRGVRSHHLIWGRKESVRYILEATLNYFKFKLDQAGIILLYIDEVARGSGYHVDREYADALYRQMKLLKREFYIS